MGPGSLELLEYASLKEIVGRHISPSTNREALEHALAEVALANSPGNAAKGSAVRITGLPAVPLAADASVGALASAT